MLVKEEICAWFKELSAAKRIDLMCGLLHMCLPLEKRFLGLFLEDLCRADYTSLRAEENKSNSNHEVKKLSNEIKDPLNRSRIILTLCLMYSTNSSCSQIMFDLLTSIQQVLQTCNKNELDRAFFDDILQLFTMAMYHPAFTFSQKYDLYDHFQLVDNYVSSVTKQSQGPEDSSLKTDTNNPLSTSASVQASKSNCQAKIVYVREIELIKGSPLQTAEKKPLFQVHVSWSDGTEVKIYKTYQEFYNFHSELIKLFPKDSGAHKQERHIPFFPQEKGHTLEEVQETMQKYLHQLSSVPDYILQCEHMSQFFVSSGKPSTGNQTGVAVASTHSHKKNQASPSSFKDREKGQNSPGHIKSQIIYNSHLDVELTKKMAKHDSPNSPRSPKSPHMSAVHSNNNNNLPPPATRSVQQQTVMQQSPCSSPLTSPLCSPYMSPSSSLYGGSRPNSPPAPFSISSWLKMVRLHKYSQNFKKYTLQEFIQLKDEELEREGLTKGAQKRFRTEMDLMKANAKPGLNGTLEFDMPTTRSPYSSCSSSSSSSNSSCGSGSSQVPNKALFRQHPHLISRGVGGGGSRETSPSSSDESSCSPAESPQPPMQYSGTHPARGDSENRMSHTKSKFHHHHGKMNINGDMTELNGHVRLSHLPHHNGPHMTLHNMAAMAAGMVRPMVHYALPGHPHPGHHPGVLMHRPPPTHFYPGANNTRSPRSPVIRSDTAPGGFMPVPRNGLVSIPSHMMTGPPPPVNVQPNLSAEVLNTTVVSSANSCCSNINKGSYGGSNSQGTMTSPVFAAAPGAYPLMTTVVSSATSTITPHCIARPSSLDVHNQPQPLGVHTSTTLLSSADGGKVGEGGSSPIPGVLTITPDLLNTSSVFQSMNGCSGSFTTTSSSSVTSTTVSYSLAPTVAIHKNASSPTPPALPTADVMTSSIIGAVPVPTPQTSITTEPSSPAPLTQLLHPMNHLGNASGNPQVMIPPTPTPTTVPTPVLQQPIQHPSASDSPGSDCSQCATSSMPAPPPPPTNNVIISYPPFWPPQQQHQLFSSPAYMTIPLTPGGTNGLVTPPTPQPPTYISQTMPHQSYMPNGISSQELYMHNSNQHMLNLMTQAISHHPHQQQQQMLACAAAQMQHSYHGYIHPQMHGGKAKTFNCYNCGQAGHRAADCPEPTMEAITNPGTFHLNMKPKENSA